VGSFCISEAKKQVTQTIEYKVNEERKELLRIPGRKKFFLNNFKATDVFRNGGRHGIVFQTGINNVT